jgi:Flp pilus assembly pilin Flp
VRQLIRRLRTCESGSAIVEYGLLIAVIALALVGVLKLFRNSVGELTNRTAVSVSKQTGSGYGTGGTGGGGSSGNHATNGPATPEPDSSSTEPESPPATGGATTAIRFGIP